MRDQTDPRSMRGRHPCYPHPGGSITWEVLSTQNTLRVFVLRLRVTCVVGLDAETPVIAAHSRLHTLPSNRKSSVRRAAESGSSQPSSRSDSSSPTDPSSSTPPRSPTVVSPPSPSASPSSTSSSVVLPSDGEWALACLSLFVVPLQNRVRTSDRDS